MTHRVFLSVRYNRFFAFAIFLALTATLVVLSPTVGVAFQGSSTGLADTTVLIIRHGEKPDKGSGLSPAGDARAQAYGRYFKHFTLNGVAVRPDTLIATADSKNSARERLTLEPLSKSLGLPLDLRFANNDISSLVHALNTEPHGKTVLIAWHHGTLPKMIKALGADPDALFPDGSWPDNAFNYVLVLHYDHGGKLIPGTEQLIDEDFANPPGKISTPNSQ